MKKIFTLALGLLASVTTFAQDGHAGGAPGEMVFVGKSNFSVLTASVEVENDTILFAMNGVTPDEQGMLSANITIPKMYYETMDMTLPSFTIKDAKYQMNMSTHAAEFAEQTFTSEAIDPADGEPRTITGQTLTATYTGSSQTFELETTFIYGRMRFPLTYKITATYDREATDKRASGDATGLRVVEVKVANDAIYDLQGRRVMSPVKGQLYVKGGKKYIAR